MKAPLYKAVIRKTLPSKGLARATLCSFVYIGMKFVLAFTYQDIIECLQKGDLKSIAPYVAFAIATVFVSNFAFYEFFVFRKTYKEQCAYTLQREQIDHFDALPFSAYEKRPKGEFLTKLFNDSPLLADTYPGTVSLLILGVFQFSLALVYGFLNSVVFTLIILAASSIACFLPAFFLKHIEKTQENKQASDAGVRDYASSVLDEVPMIKSFRAENHVAEGFDERVETYRRHAIANRKKEEMMNSVSVGIGYCVNAMWMIAGIYLIARHVITIGVFVGFISLSMELSWPFNELSRLLAGLSRASVSYTRLYPNEKVESGTKRNPEDLPADQLIQASHVFYTYDGQKDVIQDRSLTLHEGEKLLFAGPSGGGKSTFLKILAGLYTPQKGAVQRKEGLRVGYVPQTPSLFLGSIRENIHMGNPDASEQDMVEAAKKANIHDFIVRLPDGYDTHLDGLGKQNVSEGQLQRIAIARALLKKADVYLFDEITSALDEESEAAILATIRSIDAAVVMISHKPRVIDAFDQTIEFK